MADYMKKPCAHCPFREDVRPFLHPSRAAEIAHSAENRYSDFPCHKTLEYDDEEGENYAGPKSMTCAGFLAMQINCAGVDEPEGWVWPDNVYSEPFDMIGAYEEQWNDDRERRSA